MNARGDNRISPTSWPMAPARIVEHHFQSGLSARTIRAMAIEGAGGHRFLFERHYDFSQGDSSAESSTAVVRSSLVAMTEINIEQDLINHILGPSCG